MYSNPVPTPSYRARRLLPLWVHSNANATGTVTSVEAHPGWYYPGNTSPPKVGQVGTVTFKNGVITSPFTKTTYCNMTQDVAGACGA